jgi:hypothetical protein
VKWRFASLSHGIARLRPLRPQRREDEHHRSGPGHASCLIRRAARRRASKATVNAPLQAQSIIGRPMAPMPVMGGVHDTPGPIADIDLLPHSGETPKEALINPAGGHMGREPKGWTDPVISERITMP